MAGHGERLSRHQEVAIACLLTERSIRRAAAAARIDEKTIRGWLKEKDFAEAYREARRQVVEQAIARLQQSSGAAVLTLHRALKGKREGDRIKAALGILAHAIKAVELQDVLQRLEALEAAKGATT
jgi:hypothetical protein